MSRVEATGERKSQIRGLGRSGVHRTGEKEEQLVEVSSVNQSCSHSTREGMERLL